MKYAVVLIGPSGAGKSTIANLISADTRYEIVHSATTRPKRLDGNEGEYIYLSREEFLDRLSIGDLLEYTEYGENLYGTLNSELTRIFESGKIPLLVLDLNGAVSLREKKLDFTPFIFYIYEELSVIEERLLLREREAPTGKGLDAYYKRIEQNRLDYKRLPEISDIFDAFVKNDIAKNCCREIVGVINDLLSGVTIDRDENKKIANALSQMAK